MSADINTTFCVFEGKRWYFFAKILDLSPKVYGIMGIIKCKYIYKVHSLILYIVKNAEIQRDSKEEVSGL